MAICKKEFNYPPYNYTNEEEDKGKVLTFKKGDTLPEDLVVRMKAKGSFEEHGEEGKEKETTPELKEESKYTKTELMDMKKSEQVGILEDLGVGDIPRKESDRVKLIMEMV